MSWAHDFYSRQDAWSGVYSGPVRAEHRERVGAIPCLAGAGPKRVLELGAGGGQMAAATAELGHMVVAVELVPSLAAHARILAEQVRPGSMVVVEGDFYAVDVDGPFDVVTYWDGFGVGEDVDQRQLLLRIAGWLAPDGSALIDISTPWYWAAIAGQEMPRGQAQRRYGFDADGCRMLDSWWPVGDTGAAVTQSLRCYSPADLRLLLEGTRLRLAAVEPGGAVDYTCGEWRPRVPLEQCMQYLATLVRKPSA